LQNHGQDPEKNSGEQKAFQSVRKEIRKVAEENKAKLASFAVAKGKDLVTVIFHVVKELGILFFDVILSVFFGFYFLQKIAFFEGTGSRRRTRTAEWFVNLFYNSPWLPDVSRKTKSQTAKILTHIGVILTRWVRGYVTVISIEMVLYIVLFMAAGVPYALFAGIIAGLTVLLPFLGPIISFCLTVGLCLAFCENWLFLTLIFVALIYLLINGILEQFFLYPACIGEVSGLTTVETIIAVLAGGIAAGISGEVLTGNSSHSSQRLPMGMTWLIRGELAGAVMGLVA
jgi:predicted PurR-regulated permease PerM